MRDDTRSRRGHPSGQAPVARDRHHQAGLRRLPRRRRGPHAPVAARPAPLVGAGARRRGRTAVLPEEHAIARAVVDQDGLDPGAERQPGRRLHRVQRRRHARVAWKPGGARVPPGARPPGPARPSRPARRRHRPARRRVRRRGGGRAPGARRAGRPGAREPAQDHGRKGPPRRRADREERGARTAPARRDAAHRDRHRAPARPRHRRVPKGQARGARDARPLAQRDGRDARGSLLASIRPTAPSRSRSCPRTCGRSRRATSRSRPAPSA